MTRGETFHCELSRSMSRPSRKCRHARSASADILNLPKHSSSCAYFSTIFRFLAENPRLGHWQGWRRRDAGTVVYASDRRFGDALTCFLRTLTQACTQVLFQYVLETILGEILLFFGSIGSGWMQIKMAFFFDPRFSIPSIHPDSSSGSYFFNIGGCDT